MKWSLIILATLIGVAGGTWRALETENDPGDDYRALFEMVSMKGNDVSVRPELDRDGAPIVFIVDGNEFEFDIMDVGETRRHTFQVRNDGTAPLKMELLRTTCKCAIGELPSGAVMPGEIGEVTLEWTAKEYVQEYRQSATIETNDPQLRMLSLSVSGRVIDAVRAFPASLTLGDATVNDVSEAYFVLYGFKDPNLQIEEINWLVPDSEYAQFLDVAFETASEDTAGEMEGAVAAHVVRVSLKPGMPRGSFRETLKLSLNSSPWKLEVPVSGRIVSDITVFGAQFDDRSGVAGIGLVPQGKESRFKLWLLVKGAHRDDVQISLAETDPAEALQVEVGEPTTYATVVKYPISIVVPADAPVMQRRSSEDSPGMIRLNTTHPNIPLVEIPISFAIIP